MMFGSLIGVEAQPCEQGHVLAVAVVAVAGVPTRLRQGAAGGMFADPPVVVDVVALDLVGGGGGAPQEVGREGRSVVGHERSLSTRWIGGPGAGYRSSVGTRCCRDYLMPVMATPWMKKRCRAMNSATIGAM